MGWPKGKKRTGHTPYNKGRGKGYLWLLAHVEHQGDDCLIWPFGRNQEGYGVVGAFGKIHKANRLMCELTKGKPPTPTHEAAHSCGNGRGGCVHPEHLGWKTPSHNSFDKRKHGTQRCNKWGRKTPLTPEQIEGICKAIGREPIITIAKRFGVSRRVVDFIRDGKVAYAAPYRHHFSC
jgi:hypothetical protein